MPASESLQQIIYEFQGRLAGGIPPDREAALLALLRQIDRVPRSAEAVPDLDLITGRRRPELGALRALKILLEGHGEHEAAGAGVDVWAEEFLAACREIESAAVVLRLVETGAMRLDVSRDGTFHAWLIGGRAPAMWRERLAIDAWTSRNRGARATAPYARSAADELVGGMAHQLPYPPDADLGGAPAAAYRAVLGALVEMCSYPPEPALPQAVDPRVLVSEVVRRRRIDAADAEAALSAMTLDGDGVAWHADTLVGPLPPLIRAESGRLAWMRHGLLSEPLFFVARELRRRDANGYHNAARLRESVSRQDLAELFKEGRYVCSRAPIILRTREGRNRTDIDAAVFDRKTGTLAVFEMKSQDPFARSAAERARQLECLRQAAAQMSAVLAWIDREGADAVLSRIDGAASRRFRVQRVLPFVVGRYLSDGGDGAARDRRIAWASWPDFAALIEGGGSGNVLLSAHTALVKALPLSLEPWSGLPPVQLHLGEVDLWVHPSASSWRDSHLRHQ